ncbi:hypothetical protein C0389_03180 [bacterium]|nr:hypothetical protein [bacterium]
MTKKRIAEVNNIDKKSWIKLAALGFLFYTFTQGTQFIGLSLLPAVTVSLLLNFTPIIVAVLGIFLLSERPTYFQWLGACLFIVGILAYFYPVDLPSGRTLGIAIMSVGVLANATSSLLGRSINRSSRFDPLTVTVTSMGFGSVVILITGLIVQGLPSISITNILFLLWLSVVNTAFAFTLWNLTLQKLTAMESSIINGTMLIQIAVLAWWFIGETITIQEGIGMFIALSGAVIVQIGRKN